MPSDATNVFLTSLTGCRLLAPPRAAELAEWVRANPDADPTALAKEIGRRGWMTPFQVKEVYRGRGSELVVGPYHLLDLLGEGAMGRVYKAYHTRLGREVALKLIRKDKLSNPHTVRRFLQEVRAAAHLSHPNVVLALDADEIDGTHFYAMEYVEGKDLTKLVKARGPLPVPEACEYIRQAALGLHHAHERGLVHRDVKPSNLIVTPDGRVKVLDLGLAMLNATDESANRVTLVGYVIGTPDFLAPEQAQDPQKVDIRADVYALGCTLFFLLAGRAPFEGGNSTDKLMHHVMTPPPDVRRIRREVPAELAGVLLDMMAKNPADRPQTPMAAAVAMQPFAPPPPGSAPVPVSATVATPFRLPGDGGPVRVRVRRAAGGWRGPLIGLLAVAAAVLLGYGFLQLTAEPDRPPDGEFTNSLGQKLISLPAGTFTMGSADDEPGRSDDEGPTRQVTLGAFHLSATEVTNAQYAELMGRSPAAAVGKARNANELPVERVTWAEAVEFCKRLTERERRKGWAYRLPTEAEWEYASRAGTTTAFAPGDKLTVGRQAVFTPGPNERQADGDQPHRPIMPAKAGGTEPNKWGLFDLHGNVSEWCSDWYARDPPPDAADNPPGPADGDLRVVRGGGWPDEAKRCRSASRRGLPPDSRDAAVGFRVVLAPAGK